MKVTILLEGIYRVNAIPVKIPMTRTGTNIPKIYMEPQNTMSSQSNLDKEGESWRDHAP